MIPDDFHENTVWFGYVWLVDPGDQSLPERPGASDDQSQSWWFFSTALLLLGARLGSCGGPEPVSMEGRWQGDGRPFEKSFKPADSSRNSTLFETYGFDMITIDCVYYCLKIGLDHVKVS